ncbi:MAG: twin-arginine translocation signal domain-containing protein, partial [Thermoguttaceae bacterium]
MQKSKVNRRNFLKASAVTGAALTSGLSLSRSAHAKGDGV